MPPLFVVAAARSIPAWAGETRSAAAGRAEDWVYPRVGGGNGVVVGFALRDEGLSPRGRGKRPVSAWARKRRRSIPAWAGETMRGAFGGIGAEVYPRVGGGNVADQAVVIASGGLSPRGRGKRAGPNQGKIQGRSIPAWAGETGKALGVACRWWVYPRVGGGNAAMNDQLQDHRGLSPRGRGKPLALPRFVRRHRSIPAWAGETRGRAHRANIRPVYPRVGGGNVIVIYLSVHVAGLSPRGRGKLSASPSILGR